jgi:hypothetical protein
MFIVQAIELVICRFEQKVLLYSNLGGEQSFVLISLLIPEMFNAFPPSLNFSHLGSRFVK